MFVLPILENRKLLPTGYVLFMFYPCSVYPAQCLQGCVCSNVCSWNNGMNLSEEISQQNAEYINA